MKNQPNEMVTLEWLLPLFNQQLSQVADGWQLGSDSSNYEKMVKHYHEISGALIITNLPLLANLATKLSLLAGIGINSELNSNHCRKGQFAHKLLQRELTHYVQTGSYHLALLNKATTELSQILAQKGIITDHLVDSSISSTDDSHNRVIYDFDASKPKGTVVDGLTAPQYKQLLLVWRRQVQQLLAANTNQLSILSVLEKASHYLWQTAHIITQQRLWYLTKLWLHDLAHNETPIPEHYAALLLQLDQVIEANMQLVSKQSNNEAFIGGVIDDDVIDIDAAQVILSTDAIESLVTSIYVELSGLVENSSQSQTILDHSQQDAVTALRFLPRIMSELETVIFGLDNPDTLIKPLQQIKRQLEQRGWTLYASQIELILVDIERSMVSDMGFAQEQWQIESKIQELYNAIYQTEQAIGTKIGSAASFDPTSSANDSKVYDDYSVVEQIDDSSVVIPSSENLRGLRVAVEEVKHTFNEYVKREQTDLLPTAQDFNEISSAFDEMGLSGVSEVTEKMASLFTQLIAHDVKKIGWKLVQALAESLTSIELLLDYLAQQVFDQQLLTQADEHIDKAMTLFNEQLQTPVSVHDTYSPQKLVATDVLRYDDSGEVVPVADQLVAEADTEVSAALDKGDDFTVESTASVDDSDALKDAREQVKPDSYDMDEEIRDIFIEEAAEVLTDLEDFLPIWQQDIHDLTPLTEVRRGFHTLKGSGRMVGAFSVSEMAWSIENLLNRLLDKTLPVTNDVVMLVEQTTKKLPLLVADYAAQRSPSIDPAVTILQSNNLLTNQPLNFGLPMAELVDTATEQQETITSDANADLSDSIDDSNGFIGSSVSHTQDLSLAVSDLEIPDILAPFMQETTQLAVDTDDADPDIKEIFIEEANEVLAEIVPLYQQWQIAPTDLTELMEVRRGFHTLKGSGRMVGANYSAELAWSIENMLNRVLDHTISVSADITQLIADVLESYPTLVTTFENGSHDYPSMVPLWIACANAYSKQCGKEFSYSSLSNQLLGTTEKQPVSHIELPSASDRNTSEHIDSSNMHVDKTLKTIHSVNEIMAEAPVILTPQTEEEQEFCEIFIEEAETLLQDISHFVNVHQDQAQIEVSDEIVRAFHTLRAASGSSALAAISDVSATIEQSLEQLQQQDTPMSAQHLQALNQSVALIDGYLNNYKQNIEQQNLSEEDIQSEQDLASLQAMLGEGEGTIAGDNQLIVAQLLEENIDQLLDAEWELEDAFAHSDTEQVQSYIEQQTLQIEQLLIKTIDSPKFTTILNALNSAYSYLSQYPEKAKNQDVQAALLDGHAQLVGLFDALAGSMSLKVDANVLEELLSFNDRADSGNETFIDVHASNEPIVDESVYQDDDNIVQSVAASELEIESIDTDAELLDIFLEEAQELDTVIAEIFNQWRTDITNTDTLKVLQRHLHTIKGGARMAGISSIGDMTHEAENIYEAFVDNRRAPTMQWLAIMQMVQDILSLQIVHITNHKVSFFANELIEQLREFERAESLPSTVTLILPALQTLADAEPEDLLIEGSFGIDKAPDTVSLDRLIKESWSNGLPDPDILEVFLEEAEELTNRNKYLQLFLDNVGDTVALQALQRDLHTIKGGARMVASNGIADLAHEMETVYEDLASRRRPATKKILELLVTCHDWLADAVFILKQEVNPPTPVSLIVALQEFIKNPDSLKQIPNESLQTQRNTILTAKAKQESEYIEKDISEMPSMTGNFAEQEQNVGSNEMIRISGSLIEHMINLSGESAINRARIDMGMTSLTNSIEDMGTTVQRLADQLRRMEIELEAQILSQIDDELINHEGFDPLEMDQYSSLNQLSKSLTESASDLIDINSTLLEKTRDSESLLLQLSRTQTELQDGLMNSRMVPFTRLTPRLERIVRQTANELNKSVELSIINADDEMDRTILERITSPLEHMLRNAVDHGIEDIPTRLKVGKERSGRITLEVLREGSEIVINLVDDGRGIDVEAVRNKAISQGLIDAEDTSLTDLDIMQYIFNAGLTTTKQVTQISGRGVGMDVVISEIRQLGGVVSVVSKPGQGSRFTIRVPLTVAVSDALVVRAADRYYAIPLVQIERVIRVNPEKLYDYYQSDEATLHLEDNDYRVRYLNEILSGNKLNELVIDTNTSLPLIIIKNRTGQNIALQVDQIAGSRIEVVVKPLGQQLSHLAGISAATIMGDGSVMLILDLIALMRNASTLKDVIEEPKPQHRRLESQPTILVVDDSVTVRKVTSRFLERQGIKVALAKDGIDAIEILQETIPDLILLDIEMPRMDGFEVATQIRHNKRLRHIPIIMITSRTGEKHRERAFEIGVNDYMGKPFQENELLDKIQNLLGDKVSLIHEG